MWRRMRRVSSRWCSH
ncbi:hypothetical protein Pint_04936 [Pistacia integerrima]|uniref:Uncharacterized protein n=2 Tax=Pistacia TaxID=55512 RepID=A0ACC1BWJ1_9ROSI|nr:hypothetical protein Pint_04936 [Pistacia integerrima]KAJ0103445.1 hypothetical protein Patl1_05043 [Pistacia atlantica]